MSKIAWDDINWTLVQNRISRQQRRVYKASMEGNKAKVHAIQRRIIASLDAKLLAVRCVTTENKKCKTFSINKVKAISHKEKIELAYKLKINGKIKHSLLGIADINDLAKQMLVKLALEPEWEAIFEPNSYGFRPGRLCHDATAELFISLRAKPQYVLKVDTQKCFNMIDHNKLLNKLSTFDLIENQIKAWLKGDIMIDYLNRPNKVIQAIEGITKEIIISPLLANIALHGLEYHIKNWYVNRSHKTIRKNSNLGRKDVMVTIKFFRYADVFIITAPERVDIIEIQKQIAIWLENKVGVEFSKAKKMIVNSTEGFEFLGFQIISIKISNRVYKVKIHPSKKSKDILIQRTGDIIKRNRSISSFYLINLLKKRIIGWADYFKYFECSEDFSKLDYIIFNQIRAWVFRRKSKGLKSRAEIKLKYFPEGNSYHFRGRDYRNNWVLVGKSLKEGKLQENFLPKMAWVKPLHYIQLKRKV